MKIATPNLSQLASGLPREMLEKLGAALRAQDEFNRQVERLLETTAWMEPALLNGWVHAPPTSASDVRRVRIRREGRIIRSEGRAARGTIGEATPIFILPRGWWPSQTIVIAGTADAAFARLNVSHSTGAVSVITAVGNNFVDLNFSFAAAEG